MFSKKQKDILIEKGKRVGVMSFWEFSFLLMGRRLERVDLSVDCPFSSQCPAAVLRLPLHLDR